ncbi:HupE/UreJ family protein [Vibrio variabilis]|uniref:HupE/UreJ family protein n=1 Tax=Vibrio variabilis TaxID=990271 RepID=UPI000DD8BDAA|nr:HupE/UreJ family protein [Vibrio variabilis]
MTIKRIVLLGASLLSFSAFAHVGHHDGQHGFVEGFLHPLTGLDHMAYILAVGLAIAFAVPKLNWHYLIGYVAVLSLGLVAGLIGITASMLELVLASSVLLAGLTVAIAKVDKICWLVSFTILGASFHGLAHASEMPVGISTLAYFSGLLLSSVSLLVFAGSVARWIDARELPVIRYVLGVSFSALGSIFLFLQ